MGSVLEVSLRRPSPDAYASTSPRRGVSIYTLSIGEGWGEGDLRNSLSRRIRVDLSQERCFDLHPLHWRGLGRGRPSEFPLPTHTRRPLPGEVFRFTPSPLERVGERTFYGMPSPDAYASTSPRRGFRFA